jgi:hypothetical protein
MKVVHWTIILRFPNFQLKIPDCMRAQDFPLSFWLESIENTSVVTVRPNLNSVAKQVYFDDVIA